MNVSQIACGAAVTTMLERGNLAQKEASKGQDQGGDDDPMLL